MLRIAGMRSDDVCLTLTLDRVDIVVVRTAAAAAAHQPHTRIHRGYRRRVTRCESTREETAEVFSRLKRRHAL